MRLGRMLQVVAIALMALSAGSAESFAKKDRRSRNNSYFANFEREAARLREAQMREQLKAMEAARRDAERAARDAARQSSRNDDFKNPWAPQNNKGANANNNAGQRDNRNDDRKDARDKNDDGPRQADDRDNDQDLADLDDFDPSLTDAQRRVREIERLRVRALSQAQRDQTQQQRREREREDRIRKWADQRDKLIEQREKPIPVKELPGRDGDKPGQDGKDKPRLVPVAINKDGDNSDDGKSRRVKWLDGFQDQASHLGMGGNTIKGIGEREGGNGPDMKEGAAAKPDAEAPVTEPSKIAKDDARRGRAERAAAAEARRTKRYPGGEAGAELPAKQFIEEREEELIVNDLSPVDLETAKSHGFVVGKPTTLPGSGKTVQRLSVPGYSRDEAERELHKVMPFLSVTPNYAYNIFIGSLGETEGAAALPGLDRRKVSAASSQPCPDNTCFGSHLIKWKETLSSCTKDVRIGVIDTSFDLGHPAFKNLKSMRGEFLDGEQPSPYDWHGTAVLSVLAGNPHSGTPGLVPDATYLLATAFRSDAAGNASTDTARLLAALSWLEQLDVDIVNMSFSGPQDPAFARAIERMSKKGIIFTAAAGNMGPTASPSYPAAYPNVIAVTAVNRNGENYRSANRGTYIDISAPGVDILTALPDAKQGFRTGTSFAAPFVTAILATQVGDQSFDRSKVQTVSHLPTRDLGPPGQDPIYGAGLALAPQQCTPRGDAVASGAPANEAWTTTFIKAGAGFGP